MILERIEKHCRTHRYSEEYRRYWIEHPTCEACRLTGEVRYSEAPHHIRTKGAGGKDEAGNLLALCLEHHGRIHAMGVGTFARDYPALAAKIKAARGRG